MADDQFPPKKATHHDRFQAEVDKLLIDLDEAAAIHTDLRPQVNGANWQAFQLREFLLADIQGLIEAIQEGWITSGQPRIQHNIRAFCDSSADLDFGSSEVQRIFGKLALFLQAASAAGLTAENHVFTPRRNIGSART